MEKEIKNSTMSENLINLNAYFKRISCKGPQTASFKTLKQIHYLHTLSIPFENIDVVLKNKLYLDPESVQKKLVFDKRGGYCLEQNVLFSSVLKSLGFKVNHLLGRVLWQLPEGKNNPRTHMLLMVEIENKTYIADVGFAGVTLTSPLLLETGIEQKTSHDIYRFKKRNNEFVLEVKTGKEWKPMYCFSLQEHYPEDYELVNFYLTNHPESIFLNNLIAGITTPEARLIIYNNEFTQYFLTKEIKKDSIENMDTLTEILQHQLKINLSNIKDKLINYIFSQRS